MTHPRTQIRNAVVAHLAANLSTAPAAPSYPTAAGPRVHSGRVMPIDDRDDLDQLPAIVVHTRDAEQIIDRSPSGWGGYEKRRCTVAIICIAQSFDDLDEDLDTMAGQVEAALQTWTIPGFESAEIEPHSTISEDPEFEGSLTTGSTTLRFPIVYTTPYRACSDPYITGDDEPLERSGAYPGGQVTAGCPVGNTGEACPIGEAELFSDQEPIN